ncbi:hypothetical protein AMK18_00740 [Streptomyces sp. CB01249]|uniref:hypothetical protein n=1 Tax=Streptomyces sp. CB01249 TaxID=1703929 RepID=UPI00093A7BA1|nr:hypothetical protein [Streptomyces sp. CB01249]OKJ03755.1 hypothetical protein AMK18_00740 [Streptomyces sp. CB01249]
MRTVGGGRYSAITTLVTGNSPRRNDRLGRTAPAVDHPTARDAALVLGLLAEPAARGAYGGITVYRLLRDPASDVPRKLVLR